MSIKGFIVIALMSAGAQWIAEMLTWVSLPLRYGSFLGTILACLCVYGVVKRSLLKHYRVIPRDANLHVVRRQDG